MPYTLTVTLWSACSLSHSETCDEILNLDGVFVTVASHVAYHNNLIAFIYAILHLHIIRLCFSARIVFSSIIHAIKRKHNAVLTKFFT
jgi:spermidine synthase